MPANSPLPFILHPALTALAAVTLAITTPGPIAAQDKEFRMETEILEDGNPDPIISNLTIFANGVAYDFLETGREEITVVDPQHGRMMLLDTSRRVQTTLSTESVLAFLREMEARLSDTQRNFLLPAGMQTEFDQETKTLTMHNERVKYKVHGVAPDVSEAAEAYRRFADWYARLNAMREGNLPPFARIELNAILAEKKLIPQEIERTVVLKNRLGETKQILRSNHVVNWLLNQNDRKRIDAVDRYLAEFRQISFTEYLQLESLASEGAASSKH